MLLELVWHKDRVDVDQWIESYVTARYGRITDEIRTALEDDVENLFIAVKSVIRKDRPKTSCAHVPHLNSNRFPLGVDWLRSMIEIFTRKQRSFFAKAMPEFNEVRTYRIDLIHFLRQVIANEADSVFYDMITAYQEKKS